MRTTFLRTALALSAFDSPFLRQHQPQPDQPGQPGQPGQAPSEYNPFVTSVFDWAISLANRGLREEGLEMRRKYVDATERWDRYALLALESQAIDEAGYKLLQQLRHKMKTIDDLQLSTGLSETEMEQLNELQVALNQKYSEPSLSASPQVFFALDANSERELHEQANSSDAKQALTARNELKMRKWLTQQEKEVLQRAYEHRAEGFTFSSTPPSPPNTKINFSQKEIRLLKTACAKLALRNYPDGWLLYLNTMIEQIKYNGFELPKQRAAAPPAGAAARQPAEGN